ncbi:MAG TPA: OmpH family outer membrane protein [Saprospiraceae bacterium]|nr:OmpH family outer membrane protein [Saprospiraceae bacterium]HMP13542.1 OmpH family outer membrane protein [Saprospiraceae bacterium]
MRTALRITSFLAVLLLANTAVFAQKFGYINSAAVLADMPEVRQADANLEALQKQLQKKGQTMVEEFQRQYAEVQQKMERGELSPKQQEEEGRKLEAKQQELQKFEQEMYNQVQTKRNNEMGPILEKVNQAIQEVAKEGGFQFIFDEGVLLFKDPTLDITAQVKARLGIQ